MTLTLALQNSGRLDNGTPLELVLHRRGAIVGRASTCDWPLPDPTKHISARHFEVTFDGRFYVLADTSTNGTFLNGASERLSSPHRITQGDRFQVGPYLIRASLSGEAEASLRSADAAAAPPAPRAWAGWDDGNGAAAPGSPCSCRRRLGPNRRSSATARCIGMGEPDAKCGSGVRLVERGTRPARRAVAG
jgi:type VI secretion system FHA domain protein